MLALFLFREVCMQTVAVVVLLAMGLLIAPHPHADAQASPLWQSDRTTGMVSPLKDGNKDPLHIGSGRPAQNFSATHGITPDTVTPFGTPTPPNLLTPAPLLPLLPKGMAIPQPQASAVPHTPGRFGPSSGRPGR